MEISLLFQNDRYAVVSYSYDDETSYELIDQPNWRSVFLRDLAARGFELHQLHWEMVPPTEEAVEETIENYMQLGAQPTYAH